jgi:exonuclease VII small subunit
MTYNKHYSAIKKGLKNLGDESLSLEKSVQIYKKTKKELESAEGIIRKLETNINKIEITKSFDKQDAPLSMLIDKAQENIEILQGESDPDKVVAIYSIIMDQLKTAEHLVKHANIEIEQV